MDPTKTVLRGSTFRVLLQNPPLFPEVYCGDSQEFSEKTKLRKASTIDDSVTLENEAEAGNWSSPKKRKIIPTEILVDKAKIPLITDEVIKNSEKLLVHVQ